VKGLVKLGVESAVQSSANIVRMARPA